MMFRRRRGNGTAWGSSGGRTENETHPPRAAGFSIGRRAPRNVKS